MKYNAEVETVQNMHNLNENRYLHSISAGVGIPLLQAIVTGLFAGILAAIISYKLTSPDWAAWGGVIGLIVAFWRWMNGIHLWSYLVRLVEQSTGVDIDGDGEVETGNEKVIPVRVAVQDGTQVTMVRMPDEQKLRQVADLIINRQMPLSVREVVEKNHLMGRAEFEAMRDELLLRNMIRLKNEEQPKLGYSLTRRGAEMFRELAQQI